MKGEKKVNGMLQIIYGIGIWIKGNSL